MEQIRSLFDAIAPHYDLLNSLLSLRIDQRWRREAVARLKGDSFHTVLDLCAGTLGLSIALLKVNPRCRITAVDFSEPMLRAGWDRLPFGFRNRVTCIVADVMNLDSKRGGERRIHSARAPGASDPGKGQPDGGVWGWRAVSPPHSYDAIMCAYGMRNLDDNERVLRKIHSLLRPGGQLVLLEFFRPEGILSRVFNLTYAELVIPALGKLISKHPTAYQYLRDSVRGFFTPTAYRELLKSTGFQKIHFEPQTGGISYLVTAEVPL